MGKPVWKRRLNERLRSLRRFAAIRFPGVYHWYLKYLWSPKSGTLEAKIASLPQTSIQTVWQIGANEGFTEDPLIKTLRLRRWRAVLLEPQPTVYRKLQALHARQPAVTTLQTALAAQPGEAYLYSLRISGERWATGISSMDRQQLVAAIESGYVSQRCGLAAPANPDDWIIATPIPVVTPQQLQDQTGTTPDLVVVDAEGMDAVIVQSLLDADLRPRWIAFEHLGVAESEMAALQHRLDQLGYRLELLGRDMLCERAERRGISG